MRLEQVDDQKERLPGRRVDQLERSLNGIGGGSVRVSPLLCWIEVVYIEPARHAERRRQVGIVDHRHGLDALRLQDFREGRQVLNRRLRGRRPRCPTSRCVPPDGSRASARYRSRRNWEASMVRRRIGVVERAPVLGPPVQVRGCRAGISVQAQMVSAECVDDDQNHRGGSAGRRRTSRAAV